MIGVCVYFRRVTKRSELGPAIRRTNTPIAAALSISTENLIDDVPMALDTGIRRSLTDDATLTLPPASVEEMEAIPVAVAENAEHDSTADRT